MSSQTVIISTAMVISGAVIFFSLYRIKNLPSIQRLPMNQNLSPHSSNSSSLRSCLSSEKLTGEIKNKKKKRVKFADNVNEKRSQTIYTKKNNGVFREKKGSKFCEMPANRAALYHGILRDRLHRV